MNTPAFELKGNLLTLMVLKVLENNEDKIASQLSQKIQQAPDFFKQAPLVIDLQAIQAESFNLGELVKTVRHHQLIPVAIRGGNEQHKQTATSLSLGVLPDVKPKPAKTSGPILTDKIVTQPIRSGQQMVAPQGDLVILATVNPGAEVLAHRHIHIYGTLRGRALAGANGDEQARIFCQNLDAELVSVAGHYQISEEIKEDVRKKPVQIYINEEGKLKIEVLPYFR